MIVLSSSWVIEPRESVGVHRPISRCVPVRNAGYSFSDASRWKMLVNGGISSSKEAISLRLCFISDWNFATLPVPAIRLLRCQ